MTTTRTRTGTTIGRGLWLAGLVAGLALVTSPALRAQETKSGEKELGYVWSGDRQDGPKLLKELAAARVALDVEGDLAKIGRQLQDLSLRASEAQGFEGQAEALVQAALARAELQVRLGDSPQALAELRAIVPTGTFAGSLTLARPSPATTLALETARKDARIVQRIAELEKKSQATSTGASGGTDALDGLVDEAYGDRNFQAILEIGAPAFERVSVLVLREGDFPDDVDQDPLVFLVRLDERRAARFLRDRFDQTGYLWKKRTLRAMGSFMVLSNKGTWTNTRPYVCLEPEWFDLLVCFLGERDTAQQALPFVAEIEQHDALTPELTAALEHALGTLGDEFATAAMQIFDHPGVVNSAQPVLEAALGLSDARLRRFAAGKLVNFERSEALLARAKDPDVEVRRSVVQTLGPRAGYLFLDLHWNPPTLKQERGQIADPRDTGVIRDLLHDADEGIRAGAVGLIPRMEPALEESALLALCNDTSALVREALLALGGLPSPTYGRLLAALSHDSSPRIVEKLDHVLSDGLGDNDWISTAPGPFLAVLEARWKDSRIPLDPGTHQRFLSGLRSSDEGTRALVAWTLATPNQDALRELRNNVRTERLYGLPDEHLARLLGSAPELDTWAGLWDKPRPAAMRLLFADAKAARLVRLEAGRRGAEDSPAFRVALLQFLHDPSWKEHPPADAEGERLAQIASAFEGAARNALALTILQDATIAPEAADPFIAAYDADATGGRELTQQLIERWFRPDGPSRQAVSRAFYVLDKWPDLAPTELLARALPVPEYSEAIVQTVGELADPANIPLLGRALRAEWMRSDRTNLQQQAASALGSFAEDAAVALLLEGLKSDDEYLRGQCSASLIRITDYRKRVAEWHDGAARTPTKASALAELVTMLGDKDALVRKEAARGLAALGAIEALPDLIRVLKDADPSVRAAAQQAIDRLNTASATNPLASAPAETPPK